LFGFSKTIFFTKRALEVFYSQLLFFLIFKIKIKILGNLNLSRSLGDLEYKQNKKLPAEEQMITAYPDVVVENLTNDINFIVIACDGIWDCLTNQECCDFIMERLKKDPKIKLSKIIEEMFDSIIASDIYTGIIFYF